MDRGRVNQLFDRAEEFVDVAGFDQVLWLVRYVRNCTLRMWGFDGYWIDKGKAKEYKEAGRKGNRENPFMAVSEHDELHTRPLDDAIRASRSLSAHLKFLSNVAASPAAI
jgi:hypothetical protein